jgi:hypothetical protein
MNGNFTQNKINPMNDLLYFLNQQPQVWHETLEMIFNIVIRFSNLLENQMQAHSNIEYALGYFSRGYVGLRNEMIRLVMVLRLDCNLCDHLCM